MKPRLIKKNTITQTPQQEPAKAKPFRLEPKAVVKILKPRAEFYALFTKGGATK